MFIDSFPILSTLEFFFSRHVSILVFFQLGNIFSNLSSLLFFFSFQLSFSTFFLTMAYVNNQFWILIISIIFYPWQNTEYPLSSTFCLPWHASPSVFLDISNLLASLSIVFILTVFKLYTVESTNIFTLVWLTWKLVNIFSKPGLLQLLQLGLPLSLCSLTECHPWQYFINFHH